MRATSGHTADKQTRIQSPSYPIMSLDQATERAGRLYARYRSSTIDRLDAAKLLGYTGMTGPSNTALAALTAFGLLERTGKGELKVTARAVSLLHSDNKAELSSALREAAFSPNLYRELRDRFPDVAVPPEEGVLTYLNKRGFNQTAVKPAARAYLQTMRYVEKMSVTESSGHGVDQGQGFPSPQQPEDTPMSVTTHTVGSQPYPVPASPMEPSELALNEPNLWVRAGTVRVEALLDYDGLAELEGQIKALRMILKPKKLAQAPADALPPLSAPVENDGEA